MNKEEILLHISIHSNGNYTLLSGVIAIHGLPLAGEWIDLELGECVYVDKIMKSTRRFEAFCLLDTAITTNKTHVDNLIKRGFSIEK